MYAIPPQKHVQVVDAESQRVAVELQVTIQECHNPDDERSFHLEN